MPRATPSPRPEPGRHVLLVEDHPDGRESLRLLLSLLGHRVEVAADGAEGVRKALAIRPEVALIDIGLPRLDGYQVARRVRAALGRRVALIAYTASDGDEVVARVREAGFDAHLVKPVEFRALAPWLERGTAGEPIPGG